MSLTAHISTTRSGAACCELRDGECVILKAYANEAETKIRIVLEELRNYGQTLISPQNRMIEFDRQLQDAQTSSDPRGAEVKCSVDGCDNHASFIIDKKGYCFAHRR